MYFGIVLPEGNGKRFSKPTNSIVEEAPILTTKVNRRLVLPRTLHSKSGHYLPDTKLLMAHPPSTVLNTLPAVGK